MDRLLQDAVAEISNKHREIIDDWCKAYMAELYEKNGSINPGDFTLFTQNTPTGFKYWLEPKEIPDTTMCKGWISVKDRLPTKEECKVNARWFLISRRGWDTRTDISRYDGHEEEHSYDHGWKYSWDVHITHWMPMPAAYKESEQSQ